MKLSDNQGALIYIMAPTLMNFAVILCSEGTFLSDNVCEQSASIFGFTVPGCMIQASCWGLTCLCLTFDSNSFNCGMPVARFKAIFYGFWKFSAQNPEDSWKRFCFFFPDEKSSFVFQSFILVCLQSRTVKNENTWNFTKIIYGLTCAALLPSLKTDWLFA